MSRILEILLTLPGSSVIFCEKRTVLSMLKSSLILNKLETLEVPRFFSWPATVKILNIA